MALAGCVLSSFGEVTISLNDDAGGKIEFPCAPGETTEINQRGMTYTISGSNEEDDGTSISVKVPCTLVLDGLNLKNNFSKKCSLRIEKAAKNVKMFVKGRNFVASKFAYSAGIFVAKGATLTIDSAADGSAVGELVVESGWHGTAIGGYGEHPVYPGADCGRIVINGAKITTQDDSDDTSNKEFTSDGLGIPDTMSHGNVEINGGTLLLKSTNAICGETVVINGGCVRCASAPGRGIESVIMKDGKPVRVSCIPINTNLYREVYPVELPLPAIDMTGARIEGLDAGIGLKDVMPLEGTGGAGTQSLFLYLPKQDHSIRIVSLFYIIRYDLKAQGDGFIVKSDVQKVNSSVRFDGQLKVDGVPQRGKEATFSVKDAGGETNQVAFTTDTNGFFAAALPINTKAGSTNVLLEAQIEGKGEFTLNHAMTVPVVPYALVADEASEEVLVTDDRFGVVDASVTVTNDLTVTNLTVNKKLSVGGSIQSSQISAADRYDLVDTTLDGELGVGGRLHWFGKEQELLTARLESWIKVYGVGAKEFVQPWRRLQWSAVLVPDKQTQNSIKDWIGASGRGGMLYRCTATDCNFNLKKESVERHIEDPFNNPKILYDNKPVEFNIPSDGFLTVRINTTKIGAVMFALAVMEKDSPKWWEYFKVGSHIVGSDLYSDAVIQRKLRQFNRNYTIVVRKGDKIHMRLFWYSALPLGIVETFGYPQYIVTANLDVRVVFRPFGLAD